MKQKLLLVDDDPDILKVNRILLEREGYDVLTATGGEEAIELVKQGEVDLMILDIMMPGVDGFEVCQRLKESDDSFQIPVLMLTAKTELADKILGYFVGAADYLTKPYDKSMLLEKIRNLLGEKPAGR